MKTFLFNGHCKYDILRLDGIGWIMNGTPVESREHSTVSSSVTISSWSSVFVDKSSDIVVWSFIERLVITGGCTK